jgi:transcriptional regulator with XRE-family HTH domain
MTDLSLFPSRFVYACKAKRVSPREVAERAGLPADAGRDLAETAIHLPLYRLCYVADALDVSLDWLLGRGPETARQQR